MSTAAQAIIRHLLTIGGGYLTAKGIELDDGSVEVLTGAATIILGVVWSLFEKRNRA